jgi:FixJ family two-component response regulator
VTTAARPEPESGPSVSRSTRSVSIVDSDAKTRDHLAAIVRAGGWQTRTCSSAEELLADPGSTMPGCILLDVDLPGLSGLELQQMLGERAGISVVFVSACRDLRLTVRAMKAGAVNFLTKPVNPEALLSVISEALERSRVSLRRDAEDRVLRDRFAALSARELEVLKLVISGRLNKQIADELGIAQITVKVHRGRVMRKLRATSLADLVRLGARLGVAAQEGRRSTRANIAEEQSEGRVCAQAALEAAARGARRRNSATSAPIG